MFISILTIFLLIYYIPNNFQNGTKTKKMNNIYIRNKNIQMQKENKGIKIIKTIFCKYFLNNKCKYTSKDCLYAHGDNDINLVECRYGSRCLNPNCRFDHGKNNSKTYMVYNPIIKYINKKKVKQFNCIPKYNKIKNNVNILSEKSIDNGKINNNIFNKKDVLIYNLRKEIKKLKNKENSEKLQKMDKYDKYSILYDIINKKEENGVAENIKNITKDKNIYKLKLRCKKVKEYIDIIKKYNIKEVLPISNILNSNKKTFLNIINKLMFKVSY